MQVSQLKSAKEKSTASHARVARLKSTLKELLVLKDVYIKFDIYSFLEER